MEKEESEAKPHPFSPSHLPLRTNFHRDGETSGYEAVKITSLAINEFNFKFYEKTIADAPH